MLQKHLAARLRINPEIPPIGKYRLVTDDQMQGGARG